MKPLAPLMISLAGLAAADDAESIVRFSNGDRIPGSMTSLTADQLVWTSPALAKPSPFFLKNVIDLTLPSQSPDRNVDHEATITLTNGDTVRGQLAAVSDSSVTLDTWYAGRIALNRLMVSDLKIEGKSTLLYRGPTGLDGWKQAGDPPAWKFARGALRANGRGSIAREKILSDECTVAFDLAWKSDSISFKVVLFSNEPDQTNPNSGYEMSFQRSSILLRNAKTSGFLGSTHSQAMAENEKVHVEIRASRKSGKICLFLNGRIVEVWTDPTVESGAFGDTLQFVSQDSQPLKISAIEVSPWDGIVDQTPEPRLGMLRRFEGLNPAASAPKKEVPKPGRMQLANGDSIDGEVRTIENGVITVTTGLGEVKLPIARLRNISLKKVDLERCIRRNGDVRAWFPDATSIVFRLDEVGDGTLKGSSQNFGSATFQIQAFNRIEFNIHNTDPIASQGTVTGEW